MSDRTSPTHSERAYFHDNATSIRVEQVVITDKDVLREARHWTTGVRGPVVDDPDQLESADLTAFVVEAVAIGAHALAATGQAQETRALEQIVRELGDRAAQSSIAAAEITERSARDAAKTVGDATVAAKEAIVEAEAAGRRALGATITSAKEEMHAELRRLFGGENPELLDRIDPLLQKFSTELDNRVGARVSELFTTAVKQFDLDDPASPMAKHAAGLERNQAKLAEHLERRHAELTEKFDELTRELQLRAAEKRATKRSPGKGGDYADSLHTLLTELATGLGDEYTDTSSRTGAIARSKKGDGLLAVAGGVARVVVEMTDSPRTSWNDYLDEAERNHGAVASLGLVRGREQNADHAIRVLGPRRIVLAYDPESDAPDLLRTVLMLLRTAALAATSRADVENIATAEENINRALGELTGIDDIKKTASGIVKNAQKIEIQCNTIRAGIERTLAAALAALSAAEPANEAA